jgi:triacylglycerol lipase
MAGIVPLAGAMPRCRFIMIIFDFAFEAMPETYRQACKYLRRCALGLLLLAAYPAEAQVASRRDPILFVHGWRGRGEQWRTMMQRFAEDGWSSRRMFAIALDPRESNTTAAAKLAGRVDQILVATGASRVDIITHSMGALSSRYYLKNLDGAGKVDAWVSLAGPNHGTHMAELCVSIDCREMRRNSAFLAALNAGDETPGQARFATWRSACDEVIDPVETVVLEGAENHLTGCISHLGFLRDPGVYRAVRDFVAR